MKLHRAWTSVGRLAVTTVFAKSQFKPFTLISVLKQKYFGRSAHRLRPFQTAITLSLSSVYFSYILYESPNPISSVVVEKQRGNWKHNTQGALLRAKMGHAREKCKTEWVSTKLHWNAFQKKKKYLFLAAANFSADMLQRRYTTEMKKITSYCTKKSENICKTS